MQKLAGPTFGETEPDVLGTVVGLSQESALRDTVTLTPSLDTLSAKAESEWGIPATFGRYRVKKLLGQGAMGAVYLAHDTQLDRDVALKIPKFDQQSDTGLLERFYREARAVATLHHPNICPVYDVGEIEGQTFLSMAFIQGRPLADFARSQKKQGERSVAKLVMKLAQALQEAHDIGVVHRDLKPANIMVSKKGEPVVMDFGLARRLDSDEIRITQSGTIVGTPAYMSPEQVDGHPDSVGPSSDQFSLRVILYELLAGRLPFQGTVLSVIGQIAHEEPSQLKSLWPELDTRLTAICQKMMSKNPAERYENMTAIALAMNAYLTESKAPTAPENHSMWDIDKAVSITSAVPTAKRRLPKKTLPGKKPKKGGKRNKTRRWLLLAGASALFAILAGVVIFFQNSDGTVRIEISDPEIEVSFQGQTFTFNDDGTEIQVTPGPHAMNVKRGSLAFTTQEFTVEKRGKAAIKITWQDGELLAKNNDQTIGRDAEIPEPKPSPDEIVLARKFEGRDYAGAGHRSLAAQQMDGFCCPLQGGRPDCGISAPGG